MDFHLADKAAIHPSLLRFVAYCEELAGGEALPLRSSFAVGDLHWLFGFVAVADVLEGGSDYRYGYVGDFWKSILSYDLADTRVSELEACGRFPNVRSNYDSAVKARGPRYRSARLTWPDHTYLRYERLVYPFVDLRGAVTMLVIAAQCDKTVAELRDFKGRGEPRLVLELTPKLQKNEAEAPS